MERTLLISTRECHSRDETGDGLSVLWRSDAVSSPTPSHHAAPIYVNTAARSKTPHDVFVYPVSTSTPAQQPIHARQRSVLRPSSISSLTECFFFSPSFDIHSNLNDWLSNGTHSVNDPRPDSATSSVLSRDSGVARSDPKSSRDFSAKSESSSKASLNTNSNQLMSNTVLAKFARHGLPSSNTIQRLLQQQQQQPQTNTLVDSNSEQIREKLQPLNTQRLKTLRQATKSFIVSLFLAAHRSTKESFR